MGGDDVSVVSKEGDIMTQQDVIKAFVDKLANHGYAYSDSIGTNMFDSAVKWH